MTRRLSTSDAQLRSLERRALESGDPDDQAALLLQRVRVGALDRLRLELAVQCGHEPAQAVGRAICRRIARPCTSSRPSSLVSRCAGQVFTRSATAGRPPLTVIDR